MKKLIFSNILGTFVFDDKFKIIDKENTKNTEKLLKKHKEAQQELNIDDKRQIFNSFKNTANFIIFINENLKISQQKLIESVNNENIVMQTIDNIEELDKCANILSKRLREWFSLHLPELDKAIDKHDSYVEFVLRNDKPELLKMLHVSKKETFGKDLDKKDINEIKLLAGEISNIFKLRRKHEIYLDDLMKTFMPNTQAVAGSLISAKLLSHAGTLRRLIEFPSSTIQLLGAEKALFRHLRTGARCPKHGIIISHEFVARAKNKGRMARMLADKILIAAKIDYFKGKFIGNELREKLEKLQV